MQVRYTSVYCSMSQYDIICKLLTFCSACTTPLPFFVERVFFHPRKLGGVVRHRQNILVPTGRLGCVRANEVYPQMTPGRLHRDRMELWPSCIYFLLMNVNKPVLLHDNPLCNSCRACTVGMLDLNAILFNCAHQQQLLVVL